jgi:phage recombination protein Bet
MNAHTQVAVSERRSVLITMATKYSMEPAAFEQTLRATVFPNNGTREQFAAFLVVANEYGLNPLTKEIYAFPTQGGGVQPIVSVDGWCNLINSHPQLDGIEFDDHIEGQAVTAITARIWRKDRNKPIVVTEYLAECNRPTDPWKRYPRRMLRHKALIQCARYAFGFAGIVDPDEAERMGADVSPMRNVTPPNPNGVIDVDSDDPAPPQATVTIMPPNPNGAPGRPRPPNPMGETAPPKDPMDIPAKLVRVDPAKVKARLLAKIMGLGTKEEATEYAARIEVDIEPLNPADRAAVIKAYADRKKELADEA